MAEDKMTTDRQEIIAWVNTHAGQPAKLATETGSAMLRIVFPDTFEPNVDLIEWGEFFQTFDQEKLALLFQEEERFYKFVSRGLELPAERKGARAVRRNSARKPESVPTESPKHAERRR